MDCFHFERTRCPDICMPVISDMQIVLIGETGDEIFFQERSEESAAPFTASSRCGRDPAIECVIDAEVLEEFLYVLGLQVHV